MPRLRSRLLVPALALIALIYLCPAVATALPQGEAGPLVAERQEATPGRLAYLWSFLSALWREPKGAPSPGLPTEPDAAGSGDNGSGLEPDGRP